ncbi:MAG: hypothetical protein U0350_07805 [Caldilineaceae bacterium]
MKWLSSPPARCFVVCFCLLVGIATGSRGVKVVQAASDTGNAALVQTSVFLPFVSTASPTVNVTSADSYDNNSDRDKDDDDQDDDDQDDDNNSANYNPKIDPQDFVSAVTNPYFTLTPGAVWTYEGVNSEGAPAKDVVEVTQDTKTILGVTTIVVRDRAWEDGALVEDTLDWYAQDNKGNVWYFGEQTDNYENGKIVNHEGSWEAGVDGAKPGIIMEANPRVGDKYRQEYLKGQAEDQAKVLSTTASVKTKFGNFTNCVETRDWTRLEPGIVEHKYYCKEVGNLAFEKSVAGESDQLELVDMQMKK